MKCPACSEPSRVLDSRENKTFVRRRRLCTSETCGHRFTTFEGAQSTHVVELLRKLRVEVTAMRKIVTAQVERQRHLEAELVTCSDAVLAAFEHEAPAGGKARQ